MLITGSWIAQGTKLGERILSQCTRGRRDAWRSHRRRYKLGAELLNGWIPGLIFILEFGRVCPKVVEFRPRCFDKFEPAATDRAQRRPSETQWIIRLAKNHPVVRFRFRKVRSKRAVASCRRRRNPEQVENCGQDVGCLYLC